MAGKLPYMPFYVGDWMKEPSLRVCTHEVKGVYIDMLCLMWECEERGVLATSGRAWSDEEIARAVGGDQQRTLTCIAELVERSVVSRRGNGAVYSRRMVRDQNTLQTNALRQKRHYDRHKKPNGEPNADPNGNLTPISDIEIEVGSSQEDQALKLYEIYPRKVARSSALKAIRKALDKAQYSVLEEAVTAYANSRKNEDQQYTPHPATWFNQERWNDDRSTWKSKSKHIGPGQSYDPGNATRDVGGSF